MRFEFVSNWVGARPFEGNNVAEPCARRTSSEVNMRILLAFAMILGLLLPVAAQEEATPWQDAVTGQIEALRDGDAETALSFAAEGFRTQFEGEADKFYEAIMTLGYTPIAASRSHSFGEFNRVGDKMVVQIVNFIGTDQGLYEAIYELGDEGDGSWHVVGVMLKKAAGVAV
jgi:hypothetical protein